MKSFEKVTINAMQYHQSPMKKIIFRGCLRELCKECILQLPKFEKWAILFTNLYPHYLLTCHINSRIILQPAFEGLDFYQMKTR